jgi:hypothetical protein
MKTSIAKFEVEVPTDLLHGGVEAVTEPVLYDDLQANQHRVPLYARLLTDGRRRS